MRRTRLIGPQAQLWADWRHHAFVTDRTGEAEELEADHRRHAVIELAIRDLKEGAGLNHCPSGRFFAKAAWLVLAALAHNLVRWTCSLGIGIDGPVVAKTVRRRYIAVGWTAHPVRAPAPPAPAEGVAVGGRGRPRPHSPRTANRVGWLFLAEGLVLALTIGTKDYAARTGGASLPGAPWAGWILLTIALNAIFPLLLLALLVFPDGRLPSLRRRPAAWAAVDAEFDIGSGCR